MAGARILVTCPMLRVRRVCEVDGGEPPCVKDTRIALDDPAIDVALAARQASADVTWLSLCEPEVLPALEERLAAAGVGCDAIAAPAASVADTVFSRAGEAVFRVAEPRPPAVAEVDRLLDRVESHLQGGVSLVVAAGDLSGTRRTDFMERLVGRARGYGVQTFCAEWGAPLKQAFHTQPMGALLPIDELRIVSPPDPGVEEDDDATLARIFEDPVRFLVLLHGDGTLECATRGGRRSLGPIGDLSPRAIVGATAAFLEPNGSDYEGAVERAVRRLRDLSPRAQGVETASGS